MLTHSTLFTRQQVAELIGMSDDVLSFWSKNELIAPTSGGEGKGRHRKFDLFQVNIAAVLVELRKFGINIGAMRSLSRLLQHGVALARTAECNFWGINDALRIHADLEYFRRGLDVPVSQQSWEDGYGRKDSRPLPDRMATSEEDILASTRFDQHNFRDHAEKIAAFAGRIGTDDRLPLQLFFDLNHRAYGYVWDNELSDWGDSEWVVVPKDDGELEIFIGAGGDYFLGGNEHRIRSGLFLAPGAIFRHVWGDRLQPIVTHELPPSPEALAHRERMKEHSDRIRRRDEEAAARSVSGRSE